MKLQKIEGAYMTRGIPRLLIPEIGEKVIECGLFREVRIDSESRNMYAYYEKDDDEAIIQVSKRTQIASNTENYYISISAVRSGKSINTIGRISLAGDIDRYFSEYASDWVDIVRKALNLYIREENM